MSEYRRAELRSPDTASNPYLAFALLIYAALEGINGKAKLGEPADINLFKADKETLSRFKMLPQNLEQAKIIAVNSDFIKKNIPQQIIDIYNS